MKWNTLIPGLVLSMACSTASLAGAPEPETPPAADAPVVAAEVIRHRQLDEAALAEARQQALRAAEDSQRAALEAVEAARQQLEAQVQEARRARDEAETVLRESEQHRREVHDRERAVERELQRAHENLRRATREVARVHRGLSIPAPPPAPSAYSFGYSDTDRAVLGVVLGNSTGSGVKVLGVSPDGPADRAGLQQGDVIVDVMGTPLAGGDEAPRDVLNEALKDMKVGDEVAIGVDREGESLRFMVVAEKREPFTWHSYSRLATAPHADDHEIFVERIEIPEIDRERLDAEIARLRAEVEANAPRVLAFRDELDGAGFEFEFEDLSEFGDAVLAGTDVWFGMPLTQGLKMTSLDAALGAYFDSERGVLVLKAADDNGLQLRTGDVILRVGGTDVTSPGDVMRALRDVESGAEVSIDIKRERRNQTLKVPVPEHRVGLFNAPLNGFAYRFGPAPEAPEPPPAPQPDH